MANVYKEIVKKQYTNKLFLTSVRFSNIPELLAGSQGENINKLKQWKQQ